MTPAFVALFAARLAFFIAGGIVLPVASRFAAGPLGGATRSGSGSRSARSRSPRCCCDPSSAGRRTGTAAGRCSSAAASDGRRARRCTSSPTRSRCSSLVALAARRRARRSSSWPRSPPISDLAPRDAPRRGDQLRLAVALPRARHRAVRRRDDPRRVRLRRGLALAAGDRPSSRSVLSLLVPETAPPTGAAATPTAQPRARSSTRPASCPGFLILSGTWGMAGVLRVLPLYATELGIGRRRRAARHVRARRRRCSASSFATLPDRIGARGCRRPRCSARPPGSRSSASRPAPCRLLVGTASSRSGSRSSSRRSWRSRSSRVDETERGTVVGTTTAFLDLVVRPGAGDPRARRRRPIGSGGTFLVSAVGRRSSARRPARSPRPRQPVDCAPAAPRDRRPVRSRR